MDHEPPSSPNMVLLRPYFLRGAVGLPPSHELWDIPPICQATISAAGTFRFCSIVLVGVLQRGDIRRVESRRLSLLRDPRKRNLTAGENLKITPWFQGETSTIHYINHKF